MDVKEDGKIPLFNGRITMKATRVSWERNINVAKEFFVKLSKARGDRPRATASERPREEARANSQTSSSAKPQQQQQQGPTAQQNQGTSFGFEVKNKLNSLLNNV
jgi:hypothetical protein